MPLSLDDNPMMVDEEYLAYVGSATVTWSGLDIVIQILIWVILDIDGDEDYGIAVTNHMMFNNKVQLAKTLINMLFDKGEMTKDFRDYFLDRIEQAKDLSEQRNKIMHGYFNVGDLGEAQIDHYTARGKLKSSVHFKSKSDFSQFIKEVDRVASEIYSEIYTPWGPHGSFGPNKPRQP